MGLTSRDLHVFEVTTNIRRCAFGVLTGHIQADENCGTKALFEEKIYLQAIALVLSQLFHIKYLG